MSWRSEWDAALETAVRRSSLTAPKMARLQLKSSNGYIVCEAMQGGIDVTTSNAKIEVIEAAARSTSRPATAGSTSRRPTPTSNARSSNGRMKFVGSL